MRPTGPTTTTSLITNQDVERLQSRLWTPFPQKALATLTSQEFLDQNKHWLHLLSRRPFDDELQKQQTVKQHVAGNIDDKTA